MIETRLPDLPFGVVTGTVITAEGSSIFEPIIRDGRIDQLADAKQVAGLRAGLEIPAHDYLKSMRVRRIMQQELRRVLRDVDVLLAPSRYGIAPKVSEPLDGPAATAGGSQPANTGMRGLIPAGNLAGLPAISLPAGFADKMPIAIQLVSRPFTENMIVHLGTAFQKATNWHRQRPQVEIQNTQAERA
jgi:aspartyl-tRNA(Asn)/glutamyl-tRNA(Gln) amidotransferase subunit A